MDSLYIGNSKISNFNKEVVGNFVQIENETYYQIKNYDAMLPFFISIASNDNLWMYISSTGGVTAGRKNPDMSLFPYYTDDKIAESSEVTGSKTIFHIKKDGKTYLWEPFSERNKGVYNLERSILKSTFGNKIIFVEKNIDLGLTFSYAWMNADKYGWIKKSWLTNDSNQVSDICLLDGIQNVLPSGIDKLTQNAFSTLVDGYKKTELVGNSPLALFRMEAILVDRAEPSESLRANSVWSYGFDNAAYLLSSVQLDEFRKGNSVQQEKEAKGVRGAYFVHTNISLNPAQTKDWYFVAEVHQDAQKVVELLDFIEQTKDIPSVLEAEIKQGTRELQDIVAQADGIQHTADQNGDARHFANVLFNTMRGGIYSDEYTIRKDSFIKHIQQFNKSIWNANQDFLLNLPETIHYLELEKIIAKQHDVNLYRLFQEYLPLTFSRRHGDPSRPWNLFNINVKDSDGNKLLSYQGNWRDIFQNWEALSLSFPSYINGIIAKFLNATTADGYNPYKVTHEGIEWEVIEPDNPWSNIGYWGDHQIIYLLKLMEVSQHFYPQGLISSLNKKQYAYANVPYRLKTYKEIVENPKNSINFDAKLHHNIEKKALELGADAKLLTDKDSGVLLVSFTEKILATLLSKLSNFIPEAGIWMNTLRPEWNDANNALVGYGSSMVTLNYIRRFVSFVQEIYLKSSEEEFVLSEEINEFLLGLNAAFLAHKDVLSVGFDDKKRRAITDKLGMAGEAYRQKIYTGFSGKQKQLNKQDLMSFFSLVLSYIDQSIEVNKRADNMFQSYNLVSFSDDAIRISHLYEMLEGQVAVLTSGKLSPKETLDLLDSLRNSSLYREDQNSYILYPNKRLPSFLEKNKVEKSDVLKIKLLNDLVQAGNRAIIVQDKKGDFHFNADFNNADFLKDALNKLKKSVDVSTSEEQAILDLYEKVFNHQAFTGRSGTFYKYEGLGCIYWHMISKLLLAIGENIDWAIAKSADESVISGLKKHYEQVKLGIGAHKSPKEYGSFPFDPYSHTPTMAGVQQPGMTGQVKEDIINRFMELGICVAEGKLSVKTSMLKKSEFLPKNNEIQYPFLSFTYCSIPFVYILDEQQGIEIQYKNGETVRLAAYCLSQEQSLQVFNRDKNIQQVVVHLSAIK